MELRLAAILAADAVGYSRMMREDEAAALALLQKHRAEVIDPGIMVGAIFLRLIFDQPKSLLAPVEEQVPERIAAEDASRLLEGEERNQCDEEDGGVTHEARH
jgi:hypothetical protein